MIDKNISSVGSVGVQPLPTPTGGRELGAWQRWWLRFNESPEVRAYLMNGPMIITLFLISAIPIGYSFWISLQKYNLRQPNNIHFNGLDNYIAVLSNAEFWTSLRITATFTVGALIFEVITGVLLSLLLNEKFLGRGILRSAMLLPWAIPSVIAGVMWKWIFNPKFGVLNGLLFQLGIIKEYQSWVGFDPTLAMAALIFVQVWNALPFNTIVLLAALQGIPSDLYEAATVDRAGMWSRFRHITIPWLSQPIMIIMILSTMGGFRVFDLVYVLTGGGPGDSTRVVTFTAYKKAFDALDFGTANAYAYILTAITLIIGLIYIRILYTKGEIEQ
jgi:multiple sugar transport system permease protein